MTSRAVVAASFIHTHMWTKAFACAYHIYTENGFATINILRWKCWNGANIEEPSSYYDNRCALRLFSSQNLYIYIIRFVKVFPGVSAFFCVVGIFFSIFIQNQSAYGQTHQRHIKTDFQLNQLLRTTFAKCLHFLVMMWWCFKRKYAHSSE